MPSETGASLSISQNKGKDMQNTQIIPNESFLEDLINMGFQKEESRLALIAVKNQSVELALDKIFENRNKVEISQIEHQRDTKYIESCSEQTLATAKTLEKDKFETQSQLYSQWSDKDAVNEHQSTVMNEDETPNSTPHQYWKIAQNTTIHSIAMLASSEPTLEPLLIWSVQSISNSYYLDLLSVRYNKYLSNIVSKYQNYENLKLESRKVDAQMNLNKEECIQINQANIYYPISRFSVNTLIPLYLGHQAWTDWTPELGQPPSIILISGNSHQVSLDMFTKVLGCCTLADYSNHQRGVVWVYGFNRDDEPIGVNIQLSPKFEEIVVHECFNFNFSVSVTEFSLKRESQHIVVKATLASQESTKWFIYRYEDNSQIVNFYGPLPEIDLASNEWEFHPITLQDKQCYEQINLADNKISRMNSKREGSDTSHHDLKIVSTSSDQIIFYDTHNETINKTSLNPTSEVQSTDKLENYDSEKHFVTKS